MRIAMIYLLVIFSACNKTVQQVNTNLIVDTVYVDTAKVKTSIYMGDMHVTDIQGGESSYYTKISATTNYYEGTISFVGTPYVRIFAISANTLGYLIGDSKYIENFKLQGDSLYFTRIKSQGSAPGTNYYFSGKR